MAYTSFDLSTAILFYDTVRAGGVIGDGEFVSDFSFPGFQLDPTLRVLIQMDLTAPVPTRNVPVTLYSQSAGGPDNSHWHLFAQLPIPAAGTYTLAVGPDDSPEWAAAVADGEMRVTFVADDPLQVTGVRWQAAAATAPPVGMLPLFTASLQGRVGGIVYRTDTTYANDGYTYGGTADVDYAAPVAPPPPGLVRRDVRRAHQSLPTPTLVKGRPQ